MTLGVGRNCAASARAEAPGVMRHKPRLRPSPSVRAAVASPGIAPKERVTANAMRDILSECDRFNPIIGLR